MQPNAQGSPCLKARIAGLFYLLTFVAGAFAAFVGGKAAAYGNAANLFASGCYLVVTVLFYSLFKPVDKDLSLMAAVFSVAGCTLSILKVFQVVPIALNPLVLFGMYCLVIGYLTFRSDFLPRILGVMMALGGLGWLTFLSPGRAHSLSPYNLAPGMLGEGLLTLWLIAMGVNPDRWKEQAGVRIAV
jgi:hypothetical protein